jgi:hypothetical protein
MRRRYLELRKGGALKRRAMAPHPGECSRKARMASSGVVRLCRPGECRRKKAPQSLRGLRGFLEDWLPDKDSNLNKQSQNLLCYHYTIGQEEKRSWKTKGASEGWSRRLDSNPQPPVYKTGALPLSYTGG